MIFFAEEAPEGGYTARALGPSIFTQADTLTKLRENIREAVECHFEEGLAPIVHLHRDNSWDNDEALAAQKPRQTKGTSP